MSLDVINQQGAQVVALQNRVAQLQQIVVLLADGAKQLRFDPAEVEAIRERVEAVTWETTKSGRVTIKLKRPK